MIKFRQLAAVAALTAASFGAQAALTTGSLGPALTSFGDVQGAVANPGPALTGSLDLFNSTLGTLTGATLTLRGNMVTNITAEGVTSSRFRTGTGVDMGFDSSLLSVDALLDSLFTFSLSGGPAGIQSVDAGQSVNYGPFADAGTLVIDLASALGAVQAAGGGTFGISCNALGTMTNTVIGGNVNLSQVTTAGCEADIAYTFTAAPPVNVPEPASLALVGLALAGIGFSRRQSKKA